MTTEDFNVLLRSMEGQFQLVLPKPWARESDQGGVQRMLADDAVMVRNQKLETPRQGRVNPNARNETLSTICAYVKCSTGEASKCAQSFVPFGHCCAVCGAKIEIIAWNLDFDLTKTKIRQHVAEMGVEHKVETSLERKTVDDLSSKYEILLALNPGHEFDEETFEIATRRIIADLAITLKTHTHRSIMDFTIHLSKVDMTILPVSRVVASLIYFSILIVLLAGYVYKNVELRVSRNDIFKPVIRYRRQNDDVAIELDNVPEDPESLQTPEEEKSEEEHSDVANPLDVNPNFEPAGIELTDLVNTENLIEI
uniref:Protein amnionless n=1 Tax=Caenorhabditis japonica TaxID=281687 RepID=A0A8R1HIK5_CAEJA